MDNLPEKNEKVMKMMNDGKLKLEAGYKHLLTFEAK